MTEDLRLIAWFVFFVWIALMLLPREVVMLLLVVVAAGMLITRSNQVVALLK